MLHFKPKKIEVIKQIDNKIENDNDIFNTSVTFIHQNPNNLIDNPIIGTIERLEQKEKKNNHPTIPPNVYDYTREYKIKFVRWIYIVGIIAWTFLIYMFGLMPHTIYQFIPIVIPYFVFLINIAYANDLIDDIEEEIFATSYLSLGLLLIIPLITWIKQDLGTHMNEFIRIIFLSVILSLLSLIDLWIPKNSSLFLKNVRNILGTMAIVVIIYAIQFYVYNVYHT